MKPERIKPVNDPSEVPTDLSPEEEIEFWETHGVTEEFLEKVEPVPEDELPRFRPRSRPINVRFDEATLGRLKALAKRRNLGYQTLLKEFVIERLYEEEKREGLLLAGETEKAQKSK